MKVYVLTYTATGREKFFTWDCNSSITVVASNEKEARDMAATRSADEDRHYGAEERGMSIWQDPQYTKATIVELTKPTIISISFHAG